MIAALFVKTGGVYFGLPHVDPWDEARDARHYRGPWPVVAHPPCARWGSFWYGGPLNHKLGRRKKLGDDGGCFASALEAVKRFGGVIEHPANSRAWKVFNLGRPPKEGGWVKSPAGGFTASVYQGVYGHEALKPTWLYYVGPQPPALRWGRPVGNFRPISGASWHNKAERDRAIANGWKYTPRLSQEKRLATPIPFRDLLIDLARRSALGAFA